MDHSFDSSDFSTENYFHLLQILLSDGYRNVDFAAVEHDQKHLVLRHDIDFDLEAAARLAKLEETKGHKAVYFVLLTSEFYNPLSERGRAALAKILSCGHELGLHFNTSIYDGDADALSDAAAKECQILEQLTGQDTKVISMHRPPAALVGRDVNFAGRLNTYSPRFTKEMGYCSDSRGAWHFGSPLESEAYQAGRALQLATHPIWWTQATPISPQQSVADFLLNRQDFLAQEAERNCTAYTHVKISE
jgi:hypothetical protein